MQQTSVLISAEELCNGFSAPALHARPPRETSGARRDASLKAPEVGLLFPVLLLRAEGGCEGDKLRASTSEQLHSARSTMEFRGVCVLLGLLLLTHFSFQQNPLKKKPLKKGISFLQEECKQDMENIKKRFIHSLSPQGDDSERLCLKSDAPKDAAVAELQKQIHDIVQELNLLKEQQALQTGELQPQLGFCFKGCISECSAESSPHISFNNKTP